MDRSELQVKQIVRVIADRRIGTVEQKASFSDHAYIAIDGKVSKFAFSELEDPNAKVASASQAETKSDLPITEADVLCTFNRLDTSKDGSISRGELADVLQRLNPAAWTDAAVETLFSSIDFNGDGRIQWEELVKWAFSSGSSHPAWSDLFGSDAPIHNLADEPPLMLETDWFSDLFGFSETSYHSVQRWLKVCNTDSGVKGPVLESLVNKQSYNVGRFSTPTLAMLREQGSMVSQPGRLKMRIVVASIDELLAAEDNRHATFQVASQFNCLETMSPTQYPEEGVGCYSKDKTQGPACSIACGAATVFRNYFVPLDANKQAAADALHTVQRGQTQDLQIDNLADVGRLLGNDPHGKLFQVRTGWILADDEQLEELQGAMETLKNSGGLDEFRAALRVGVQRDTQVTSTKWGSIPVRNPRQLVTQVFASACPTNASATRHMWADFAVLVLEAAYEATIWAALLSAERYPDEPGSRRIFLTCLGGGAFGNSWQWIIGALRTTMARFKDYDLDVRIVSHKGPVDEDLKKLASEVNSGLL